MIPGYAVSCAVRDREPRMRGDDPNDGVMEHVIVQ